MCAMRFVRVGRLQAITARLRSSSPPGATNAAGCLPCAPGVQDGRALRARVLCVLRVLRCAPHAFWIGRKSLNSGGSSSSE
jgi:hypothetical protein